MALILIGWLAIWCIGEAFGIWELVRGPFVVTISMILWLLIWSTAGVCVSLVVLWTLFGSERLFIVHDAVLHEPGVGPFRFKRQWTPGHSTDFYLTKGTRRMSAESGWIAFHARGKNRRFGFGMSKEELRAALAAIECHLGTAAIRSAH